MELHITCDFPEGPQILVKLDATEADLTAVRNAMDGDPQAAFSIECRLASGVHLEPRQRLIRAGVIRCVDVKR
jgi:hypothetical protein